ncbi:MAG: type II toxin-antitoxin system prevent-host-death family antitoxin [Verrucomicrobiae bacterium]|nr:type II toxin-antitoxin system prevent-host-death family antitoxin [Verrucomicrobiae bacterium]
MKTKRQAALYKQKPKSLGLEPESPGPAALSEAVALPGVGLTIPVRAAKAKLSALLEMVASGQEVTITSDGKPKAVLSPVGRRAAQKVFTGMGDHLKSMPMQTKGPFADEIVRTDRDGRGW